MIFDILKVGGYLKSTQDISLQDKHTFNTLMYADDLIIMSTSKENLKKI